MPDLINFAPVKQQVDAINFDIEVKAVRDYLMGIFAEHGLRTDVAVAAMAEIVGIAAAKIDEEEGVTNIADRLHAFNERAEAFYHKRRHSPKQFNLTGMVE